MGARNDAMQQLMGRFISENVQDFWRWWSCFLESTGRPPRRSEVDLPSLRRTLSKLWLVEWREDGDTFQYRLAGEAINLRYGFNLKGMTPAELFTPVTRAAIEGAWRQVLAQPAVAYQAGEIYPDGQTILLGERLAVPLLDDAGRQPRFVLGITDHPPGFPEDMQTVNPLQPDDSHLFFPIEAMLPRKATG